MKKSELEMTTLVYVIIALIAITLIVLLYIGLNSAGSSIFDGFEDVFK